MDRASLNPIRKSPLFNILLFSGFWALQLFVTKLALNAGAQVLSYQVLSLLAALAILAVLLLPRFGSEFRSLFRDKPGLFWRIFFANGIQSGLGTCLSIIGISLTSAINAGFLVKLSTVTTILFAWIILKERLTVIKILMVFSMLSGAYLLTTKGQILLPRIGDLIFGSLNQVLSCCKPPSAVFPYIIGNGVLLTFTWTYLNNSLKISSASYMTMMSMVAPVFVSLLAMIFLGERMVWIQVIGAGVIILSGVITYFSGISTD